MKVRGFSSRGCTPRRCSSRWQRVFYPLVAARPLQLPERLDRRRSSRRASSGLTTSASSGRQHLSHGDRQQLQALPGRPDPGRALGVISAILFDRRPGLAVLPHDDLLPYVLSIPVVGVVFGYVFQENGIVNSGAAQRRAGRARPGLAGIPAMGALDDHGGDRLEGARVRRDPLPRAADERGRAPLRGRPRRRRRLVARALARHASAARAGASRSTRSSS